MTRSTETIDMHRFERPLWLSGMSFIAGVDEAGRGPLAGPVVAAAVIMPPDFLITGVNDSKQLTEARRDRFAEEIRRSAISIGVGIVDHSVIDEINILQATFRAMREALAALNPVPQQVLADGNFFRHDHFPVMNIVKGDALSHSIAAASIIAKTTRDAIMVEMDTLYPQYGFAKHKGYGTAKHIEAMRQNGLSPIHRRSFEVDLR